MVLSYKRNKRNFIRKKDRDQSSYMVPTKKKTANLHQKIQQLRTLTNSTSENETEIIGNASEYINQLKAKVDRLNHEILQASNTSSEQNQQPLSLVDVETLEKGFMINVVLEKRCPGLLVSILEAFEKLGLGLIDARVSCEDKFQLEAVGEEEGEKHVDGVDAEMVKEAVSHVIQSWIQNNENN